MVRQVLGLVLRDGRSCYELACGHQVIAEDYSQTRGIWKPQAWCPTCWTREQAHPCGTTGATE